MFGFGRNILETKQNALAKLSKKSISSIATVQSAVNKLVAINDNIDRTTHEIEEIESSFSLIKGELDTRKQSNAALINQIKQVTEPTPAEPENK